MNIELLRPSFTIYVVASDAARVAPIVEGLSRSGYMVATFDQFAPAFSEIFSNPPHFIFLDAEEKGFPLGPPLKQLASQFPETHVFLITPLALRERMSSLLNEGVHQLALTPLASSLELVRAIDTIAERDYLRFAKESRPVVTSENADHTPSTSLEALLPLFDLSGPDEVVSAFLRWASEHLKLTSSIHLKFIANRRLLLAMAGEGLPVADFHGLGINLNELNPNFRTAQLRDPQSVPEIESFAREVLSAADYMAIPIEILGELHGVILFLVDHPNAEIQNQLHQGINLLQRALTLIETEKRLHVLSVKDPHTDLFNRQHFVLKIRDEVSRARRTQAPVSLLLLNVDQYGQVVTEAGPEEAQILLKMVARIFVKHSRVNDLMGRTGGDEFGIILPHTRKDGAMIKAERLRRIIESADFSKVLKAFPRITVSIGIAEYPGMVRDAEELLQYAEEALYQVRTVGNKTCVATPPDGFVADFEVL